MSFDKERRTLLAGLAVSVPAAVCWPRILFAKREMEDAFASESLDEVMKKLTGGAEAADAAGRIHIKAPTISENGAVVPVSVDVDMDKVDSISILVEKNPLPLSSSYQFHKASAPYVSTRIKMLKTSNVVALVGADDKYYQATQLVKVTIGGCGG